MRTSTRFNSNRGINRDRGFTPSSTFMVNMDNLDNMDNKVESKALIPIPILPIPTKLRVRRVLSRAWLSSEEGAKRGMSASSLMRLRVEVEEEVEVLVSKSVRSGRCRRGLSSMLSCVV